MTETTKKKRLSPLDMGRKIMDVYENDPVLGVVLIPFGTVFGIWLITRDEGTSEILLYISIAVGMVAFSSSIKHIALGFLQAKYGIIAQESEDRRDEADRAHELTEVEVKTAEKKELAETHWQMEMILLLAQKSGHAANSFLTRTIEYLKNGGDDPDVLEVFADTLTDVQKLMVDDKDMVKLPFKPYIDAAFSPEPETDTENIPKSVAVTGDELIVEDIQSKADEIVPAHPSTDDMKTLDDA